MFKRSVLTLCFLAVGSAGVCGAGRAADEPKKKDRPDLNGTWILEKDKDGKGGQAEVTLLVTQREPEIKVTRKVVSGGSERVQELIYYTDSRGEVNPTLSGKSAIRTKTRWNGNTLIIKEDFPPASARGVVVRHEVTEEWKVSADGQTLTQKQETALSEQRNMPDASVGGLDGTPGPVTVGGSGSVVKRVYKRSGRTS